MNQPIQSAEPPAEKARARTAALLTPRRVFGGLAIYFLLHILWRVAVSGSVELDESEQLIQTQSWAWGYAGQPPLYTWLQAALFALFGRNVFALVFLKSALLFGSYYFLYRAAREIVAAVDTALVSALCLFFLPQIAWESQRDLTHSVLATCAAAATLFIFLKLLRTGCPGWHGLLGLAAGLGLLAKYNYGIFFLVLLISALFISPYRRRLLSPWSLLSFGIFLAVVAGHFVWLWSNPDSILFVNKFPVSDAQNLFDAWLAGGKSLLQALVSFAGPLVLLFFCLFFKRTRAGPSVLESPSNTEPQPLPDAVKLLQGAVLGVVIFCILAIIFFKAQFKDRWFQPLLFLLPVLAVLRVHPRLTAGRKRILALLACLVAGTILVVMPAIPLAASVTERPTRLNAPWSELARQLQQSYHQPGVILADSCLPGGNLKLSFQESLVLSPECAIIPPRRDLPWLIIWDANKQEDPPPELKRLYARLCGPWLSELKPVYVEVPWKYYPGRKFRVGYVLR